MEGRSRRKLPSSSANSKILANREQSEGGLHRPGDFLSGRSGGLLVWVSDNGPLLQGLINPFNQSLRRERQGKLLVWGTAEKNSPIASHFAEWSLRTPGGACALVWTDGEDRVPRPRKAGSLFGFLP